MKLRKRKKKKRFSLFIIFLLLIYLFSFFVTIKYYFKKEENSAVVKYLLNNGDNRLFTKFINFILDIDLSNCLTLIDNNYIFSNDYNSSDEIKHLDSIPVSNYVKDPNPDLKIDNPIVYLYNTHQSEEYATSNNQNYNIKPTVMTASYIIREQLNKNNIPTIVEENDVTEFLRTNNWNYAASYKVTRLLMDDAKNKNNSLVYYIDLHRDSVKKSISTVNIDGKNYAKILFIIGLENSNYQENLSFTEELNKLFKDKYPNLSRGIYKKKGSGVNGVYNQDFSPRTILIEIGGEDNTIDEVYNTCSAISDVLIEYIKGENYEK